MKDLSELKQLKNTNDLMRLKERLRYDILLSEQTMKTGVNNLMETFLASARETIRSYTQDMLSYVVVKFVDRFRN